jgi:hypothetical protein
MAGADTLRRLREVLARELETISQYEAHAEAEPDPEAKALFTHLANEEKEHVTEVYEALLTRDQVQAEWGQKGAHAAALREQRFTADVGASPATGPAGTPQPAPPAPQPAAPAAPKTASPRPPVTIGSLLGRPQD